MRHDVCMLLNILSHFNRSTWLNYDASCVIFWSYFECGSEKIAALNRDSDSENKSQLHALDIPFQAVRLIVRLRSPD